MFEWLKFIGEFFLGLITGVDDLFLMFGDAITTVSGAVLAAPSFLYPIMHLMLAVAIVMWVVNIF